MQNIEIPKIMDIFLKSINLWIILVSMQVLKRINHWRGGEQSEPTERPDCLSMGKYSVPLGCSWKVCVRIHGLCAYVHTANSELGHGHLHMGLYPVLKMKR